jgi:hypothetical protein
MSDFANKIKMRKIEMRINRSKIFIYTNNPNSTTLHCLSLTSFSPDISQLMISFINEMNSKLMSSKVTTGSKDYQVRKKLDIAYSLLGKEGRKCIFHRRVKCR